MGIKIKNLQTGEFEKFNIPALKGEKGEPGEIEPSEKVDYIGKQHSKLRDTMNANVDYIIKTAIGEFNYLDYEGQHITAAETIEGHAKSAILKGQTLVNQINDTSFEDLAWTKYAYESVENGVITFVGNGQRLVRYAMFKSPVEKNQTYTAFVKIKSDCANVGLEFETNDGDAYIRSSKYVEAPTNGFVVLKCKITVKNHNTLTFVLRATELIDGNVYFKEPMLIKGDFTNVDIPYFTGMQSVKMPVLTTRGVNLFSFNMVEDLLLSNNFVSSFTPNSLSLQGYGRFSCVTFTLQLESNAKYNIGCHFNKVVGTINNAERVVQIENSANRTVRIHTNENDVDVSNTFTTSDDGIVQIIIYGTSEGKQEFKTEITNFYINEYENGSAFEPYKSNILTVNEDVVLRGIGNMQDELNLLTGELTQRIGEVVLDGSENWILTSDENDLTIRFALSLPLSKPTNIICEQFKVEHTYGKEYECIQLTDNKTLVVRISKEKATTLEMLKQWLSQNPITVQYELATPTVKTVDLSDNHVYSYKGTTHYDCSSAEGSLVPTLSVKVPTDTQLTIQEQKATTQTLLIKNMDLQQSIKEVQAMNLAFNTALYNSFNSIREEVEDIKKHVSTNENLEGSF